MTVGYAYDFGVSALNVRTKPHEIVISLTACDKDDLFFSTGGRCPAYD